MERGFSELRTLESQTWAESESKVPENAAVFHDIVGIHHELILRAMGPKTSSHRNRFERGMCLLAAKSTHLVRAAWISTLTGYPGGYQPLVRGIYETSLTMFYLRRFPGDFGAWIKESKTSNESGRFWPSKMMDRLGSPPVERQILSALAQQAHPNAESTTLFSSYDAPTDQLQIDIGAPLEIQRLTSLTSALCLFGAISAYTIARTLKGSLVHGLPDDDDVKLFFERLQALLAKRTQVQEIKGTKVFDLFNTRRST